MRMMNELISDALDSQKFVDKLKAGELTFPDRMINPKRYEGESRTERRARERAEAKAARKAKA